MLHEKSLLAIPGPTPLAPSVLRAMAKPMVNHRGELFVELFHDVQQKLQRVYRTTRPVVVMPSAGTGAMEAAIVNFFSPRDKVLALVIGVFGDRWATIAQTYGLDVERVDVPWGQAVDPAVVAERLQADKEHAIKAVLVTHNETSTGITNPLQAISAARGDHPALLLVDAISSMGSLPLEMDAWNLDVVVTGAQKGLATPPGLGFIAFGDRADAERRAARLPRYYWDLDLYLKGWDDANPPYTPSVSLWYALQQALVNLEEETLEGAWARHRLLGEMARAGVAALGLELFADAAHASDTVTAVKAPAGIAPKTLRKIARERFGVVLAGGQKHLIDSIFRIGHVGFVSPQELLQSLAAVEMTLGMQGRPELLGRASAAAQKVWLSSEC